MCDAGVSAFSSLAGWEEDDHEAALTVYTRTVQALGPEWPRPDGRPAKTFFEAEFSPAVIGTPPAIVTGYYEPEISGSPDRSADYPAALHAPPAGHDPDRPWHSRAEIVGGDLLSDRALVWLESPVAAFMAQVQGSVRVRLPDGTYRRFGYAGRNGHPYRSIGQELVRRGEVPAESMSARAILDWCAAHPADVAGLLCHNPSYVYFRPLDTVGDGGPVGTMGASVTAGRSIAVDPDAQPLGAPVWLEFDGIARLVIAQDTGSAIKGAQRADLICGTGDLAGEEAGAMRGEGRLTTFLPRRGRAG